MHFKNIIGSLGFRTFWYFAHLCFWWQHRRTSMISRGGSRELHESPYLLTLVYNILSPIRVLFPFSLRLTLCSGLLPQPCRTSTSMIPTALHGGLWLASITNSGTGSHNPFLYSLKLFLLMRAEQGTPCLGLSGSRVNSLNLKYSAVASKGVLIPPCTTESEEGPFRMLFLIHLPWPPPSWSLETWSLGALENHLT